MRISERGQVTVPLKFRQQFGLQANTEVEFIADNNGLRLIPSPDSRVQEIQALYGSKQFTQSTDELMKLLREPTSE